MVARILLGALLVLVMVSGIRGQNCVAPLAIETCSFTTMSGTDASGNTATLNVGFTYCAPTIGYGVGTLLAVQSGTLSITSAATGTITSYPVTALSGTVTTAAPLTNGFSPVISFGTATTAATITINGGSIPITLATNVPVSGITLVTNLLPAGLQTLNDVTQDSCTHARGDPLFSGFFGQQFYLGGVEGFVYNLLSTFNMQLNARLVRLDEGQALYPYQQEQLRVDNEARLVLDPSLSPMPKTTPWSHPGNYFSEAGVTLVDNHRLYAQAGAFEHGWAKLTLDGRSLPVSDDYIVLGYGVNTTTLMRASAHEIMVRTVNVEFTLVNSDNFINVDHVHLERGARSHKQFAGILGVTADSKWTWNPQVEEDSTVKSGNLFDVTSQQA